MGRVVLAPDSFKGSLSSLQICRIVSSEWQKFFPDDEIFSFPMADGGEGTVEALVNATGGKLKTTPVLGPLGDKVEASWGILGDGETAVIEMAAASGLYLLEQERRNPFFTSTFGTGQLIRAALEECCTKVIIGIGGSATNDGGAGMAKALGIRFLDKEGVDLPEGGRFLAGLERIDFARLDLRVRKTTFVAACDVDNLLCGPQGTSAVYGPQKGASPEMVRELDSALYHYARIIKKELDIDVTDIPGAGAAGGLGAGLQAFLGATLEPGVSLVISYSGMEKVLQSGKIDLVVTGEGEINAQTIRGKVPWGVAGLAKKYGIPVVAIVGSRAEDAGVVFEHGIDAVLDIIPCPMTLAKAMEQAEELVRHAAATLARLYRLKNF